MDRRQRKTREAIFSAFLSLLSQKDLGQITVGEIIQEADVGRATFYAHFPTKDFLLKELCEDLFCHIFDGTDHPEHKHLFACDAPDSPFLHLFQHFMKNDNQLLQLLSCPSNALFLRYFKEQLQKMVATQQNCLTTEKAKQLPEDFWINHICATFVETLRWWIENGKQESPETLAACFYATI